MASTITRKPKEVVNDTTREQNPVSSRPASEADNHLNHILGQQSRSETGVYRLYLA